MDEAKAQPFTPNFLRPVPEFEEEAIQPEGIFLVPGALPEPYWDYTLGFNVPKVKSLMQRAHESPLTSENIKLILDTFSHDQEALVHCCFHPDNLPNVIVHNKEIAIDFLNRQSGFDNITEYYNIFLTTETNLNNLEVFNSLVQSTKLPPEFILLYIKNCYQSCDKLTDPKSKKRMVRIVCIVIKLYLSSRLITIEDLSTIDGGAFFTQNSTLQDARNINEQITQHLKTWPKT